MCCACGGGDIEIDDVVFQPQTTAELQTAVDMWVDDNATALATYGHISSWNVSAVTDMKHLFLVAHRLKHLIVDIY